MSCVLRDQAHKLSPQRLAALQRRLECNDRYLGAFILPNDLKIFLDEGAVSLGVTQLPRQRLMQE
jgi:hypothetical protein